MQNYFYQQWDKDKVLELLEFQIKLFFHYQFYVSFLPVLKTAEISFKLLTKSPRILYTCKHWTLEKIHECTWNEHFNIIFFSVKRKNAKTE